MNARVVSGVMVRDGDTVVLGDTGTDVGYVVLCRRHHRAGQPYAPATLTVVPERISA
jgi:thymidine kinase